MDHSLMCLTRISFYSTPPPTTPTPLLMIGIGRCSCATPHGKLQLGRLVQPPPLTSCEPKTCIDVDCNLRSTTPRGETASTRTTTTLPPQSQLPRTPMVFTSSEEKNTSPNHDPASSQAHRWRQAATTSEARKVAPRCVTKFWTCECQFVALTLQEALLQRKQAWRDCNKVGMRKGPKNRDVRILCQPNIINH